MGLLTYEEMLAAAVPPPLKDNGTMARWYAWLLRCTFFISCVGILAPVTFALNAIVQSIFKNDFDLDMVLAVNLTAIFVVSVSALIAHQYNHRGAYFPILAYLWFIKYGSTSTLAHHLAIMCARSYTKHAETPDQIEFEYTMIYFSIPILLVTALFHYLYYVVYENSPLFDDDGSEGSEVAEI